MCHISYDMHFISTGEIECGSWDSPRSERASPRSELWRQSLTFGNFIFHIKYISYYVSFLFLPARLNVAWASPRSELRRQSWIASRWLASVFPITPSAYMTARSLRARLCEPSEFTASSSRSNATCRSFGTSCPSEKVKMTFYMQYVIVYAIFNSKCIGLYMQYVIRNVYGRCIKKSWKVS